MKEKKEIVIYQDKTALDIFQPDGVATILAMVRAEVTDFKPDTSTDKGRKEIASKAYQASQAKTRLETAGKDLVSEWKEKAKAVDGQRKELRDGLDSLRDEVRQPLTDWETAEAARVAAEKLAEEMEEDHENALAENSIIDRQKELDAKELAIALQEEVRLAKEVEAQAEADRIEREEQIRKDALAEAEEAVKQAERETIEAEERAKIQAEQAETEKAAAIELATQQEKERIEEEQRQADILRQTEEAAQAKAAENKSHQKAVNNTAVQCLEMSTGVDTETAKKIITAIAKGDIASVTINY